MTWDPRLYFPSEGSHTQDFYALEKKASTLAGIEPMNLGSRDEYDNHWTTGVDWVGMKYSPWLKWKFYFSSI